MIENLKGDVVGWYYDSDGYIEGIKLNSNGKQYLVDIFTAVDNLPWPDETIVEAYHVQEHLMGRTITLDYVKPDRYYATGSINIEEN